LDQVFTNEVVKFYGLKRAEFERCSVPFAKYCSTI